MLFEAVNKLLQIVCVLQKFSSNHSVLGRSGNSHRFGQMECVQIRCRRIGSDYCHLINPPPPHLVNRLRFCAFLTRNSFASRTREFVIVFSICMGWDSLCLALCVYFSLLLFLLCLLSFTPLYSFCSMLRCSTMSEPLLLSLSLSWLSVYGLLDFLSRWQNSLRVFSLYNC